MTNPTQATVLSLACRRCHSGWPIRKDGVRAAALSTLDPTERTCRDCGGPAILTGAYLETRLR